MAHRQEPKRKAPTLDKYIKIEWKFERKKKEKTFERTFRSKARIKNSISLSPIFSPSPSFPFFFSFFIKTQSLKISLAIQRNAEGINKPDNVGAFCKSESGRSGIIQVGRTRGNEEKRDQPRTSWMKGDGGASIDAAKLFNGQVELPRAPFFSLPCFLFPFTGVCAPLFIPFSLFFFFFNFFPFLSFYSRKGMKVAEDARFRRACCRCSFNRQFEFTPPAQSTLLPARDDEARTSARGEFPRFRIPAIPIRSSRSLFRRTKISRAGEWI